MFRSFFLLELSFGQGAELQFFKQCLQLFLVRLFHAQFVHVECDGCIRPDSGEEFGEGNHLLVGLHFCADGSFQLVGMLQQVFDTAELVNQFGCRFFSHTRTSWNVVRLVAHQAKHVDDLGCGGDVELLCHLFHTHDFEILVTGFRAVHPDSSAHQLAIVLVGRHHVSVGIAALVGLSGQCADDVVGFESRRLYDGDAVGTYDVFYDRYGCADGFRCLFALRLVFGVGFMTEGRSGGVESHADVRGFLFVEHLFECVDEA